MRIFVLYYSCTIGVLNLLHIETDIFQALLYTAIPSIVDNETFFDSQLRGNFGPTSTTCSASPSLSGTHCGPQRLCGAIKVKSEDFGGLLCGFLK